MDEENDDHGGSTSYHSDSGLPAKKDRNPQRGAESAPPFMATLYLRTQKIWIRRLISLNDGILYVYRVSNFLGWGGFGGKLSHFSGLVYMCGFTGQGERRAVGYCVSGGLCGGARGE